MRRELEEYSRRKHIEAGYEFVNTPHITKAQLFDTSGHLAWYAEGKLKPHISMRFPLDKGADAMNALLSRKATGKVVIKVR